MLNAYIDTNAFQKDVEPAQLTTYNGLDNGNGSNNETSSTGDVWYRGSKLQVEWLLKHFNCLKKETRKIGNRNRPYYMECIYCKEFESEISKYSKNRLVPMSGGIEIESRQKLERVVDHLNSKAHLVALHLKKGKEAWDTQSENHPWIKILKNHQSQVINQLLHLCIDVFNDSLLETPSARTWPARSLSHMMASSVQAKLEENWDAKLESFDPSPSDLHYRDPVIYSEMLKIVGTLEKKKLSENMANAICYAIQVDGSSDRSNKDNRFITARFIPKENSAEILTVFLGVFSPEDYGANGLLTATTTILNQIGLCTDNLVRVTTDGEAANIGKNTGLWKLLQDHVGHKLLTVWCTCHRSDLAMESVISSVPEMKIWLMNLTSIASYFHTAPLKTKLLKQKFGEEKKFVTFPKYFEVRFAEHTRNIILSVINNLPECKLFWKDLISDKNNKFSKTDKNAASGMLRTWNNDSLQFKITLLMADITQMMQTLQQQLQKDNLILPDVLTARDSATRKLDLILDGPIPGGIEDKYLSPCDIDVDEDTDDIENVNDVPSPRNNNNNNRRIYNTYVNNNRRCWGPVRQEIVLSFKNFLCQRLNVEEDETTSQMIKLISANSCKEIIEAGCQLVENIFGHDKVLEFVNNVTDFWPIIEDIPNIDTTDKGTQYSLKLRTIAAKTSGILQKLFVTLLIVCPHSMTTERVISHYNQIKTIHTISLLEETINYRLYH